MKNLIFIALLLFNLIGVAQDPPIETETRYLSSGTVIIDRFQNFGFNESIIPINFNLAYVRLNSEILVVDDPSDSNKNIIYYIDNSNHISKIYFSSNQWNLLTFSQSYVHPSVNKLTYNGSDIIYYVSNNNKIYSLNLNTNYVSQLITSLLYPQDYVDPTSPLVYNYPAIFFVNLSHKICNVYHNGSNWLGGNPLVNTNTVDARSGSELISPFNNMVYYIGTDNKLYEIKHNGINWSGGAWPVSNNMDPISMSGVTNFGQYFIYVGETSSKINHVYWDNSLGFVSNIIPGQGTIIANKKTKPTFNFSIDRSSRTLQLQNIFYVRSDLRLQHLLYGPSTSWQWISEMVDNIVYDNNIVYSSIYEKPVKENSQLFVWDNQLFEEGSETNKMSSLHVFYTANDNNLPFCAVQDDKIDPLWSNVSNEYDWYSGRICPRTNIQPLRSNNGYAINSKYSFNRNIFYYVGNDNAIHTFSRKTLNILNPLSPTVFDEEFDFNSSLTTNWNNHYPWGRGHSNDCYNMDNYQNAEISVDNYVKLKVDVEPPTQERLEYKCSWVAGQNPPENPCEMKHFEFSGQDLSTDYQIGSTNDQPLNPNVCYTICDTYSPNIPSSPTKFSTTFGTFEGRAKTPRSKNAWSAFWLPGVNAWPPEIDIFENSGNGKQWYASNHDAYGNGWDGNSNEINAIGFRYYDDFYTYKCVWEPNKIEFYFNNELITSLTDASKIPSTPVSINIWNQYYLQPWVQAEMDIYPNYLDFDYVRVWPYTGPLNERLTTKSEVHSNPIKSIIVQPNPAKDQFLVKCTSIEIGTIDIYNITGKKVLSQKFDSFYSIINSSNLNPGLYLINVKDIYGIESFKEKLIIE